MKLFKSIPLFLFFLSCSIIFLSCSIIFLFYFLFDNWADTSKEKLQNDYDLPPSLIQSVSSARRDVDLNVCEISLTSPLDEKVLLSEGWIQSKDGYYCPPKKSTASDAARSFKLFVTDESKKELYIR